MKHKIGIMGWLLAALVMTNTPLLYADVFEGEVVEVDMENSSLKISSTEPFIEDKQKEPFQVFIASDTRMEGAAFPDLRPGDEVRVNATRNATGGTWNAISVEIKKVAIQPIVDTTVD